LVLPAAPGVRARGTEADPQVARERCQLGAPLGDADGRLGKRRAAASLHLDLGRDQLADEMLLEDRAARRGLQLLEAAHEVERERIEERELLLDGDREVLGRLERLARRPQLLFRRESLFVAHGRATLVEALARTVPRGLAEPCPREPAGTVPTVPANRVRE